MRTNSAPEAGKPELASGQPSALALAIIAALTLSVSTDHLGTAAPSRAMVQGFATPSADHDASSEQHTA